ncbi:MAG: hypothetical protein HKK66_03215 [Chlorobiaceae bacterium]|nr:hypothetical protein [Chlorobiaceae bacterium]
MQSVIDDIEGALKSRLQEEITGLPALVKTLQKPDGTTVDVPVKVESYPRQPSEQLLVTLATSGALVVRYTGSKYSRKREVCGITVQDRTMGYEVLVFSDSLLARDTGAGIYELLDLAALRLIGFLPDGCVDGVELERDDYVEERKGAWTYGILLSVKTQTRRVA